MDIVVGAVLRGEGAVRSLQVGGDVEVAPAVFGAEGLHACVQRIDGCIGELALFGALVHRGRADDGEGDVRVHRPNLVDEADIVVDRAVHATDIQVVEAEEHEDVLRADQLKRIPDVVLRTLVGRVHRLLRDGHECVVRGEAAAGEEAEVLKDRAARFLAVRVELEAIGDGVTGDVGALEVVRDFVLGRRKQLLHRLRLRDTGRRTVQSTGDRGGRRDGSR